MTENKEKQFKMISALVHTEVYATIQTMAKEYEVPMGTVIRVLLAKVLNLDDAILSREMALVQMRTKEIEAIRNIRRKIDGDLR